MRSSKPRLRRAPGQGKAAAVETRVSVKCAFCKGKGRDPYGLSRLSRCVACGGKRTQLVAEPYETCPACEGAGLYFRSHMYCWTCRGKGVIPAEKEAAEPAASQQQGS